MQGKAKRLLLLAIVLAGAGLLILVRPVSASHLSRGVWSHSVPACAVEENSLDRYTVTMVSFQHLFVSTGQISTQCSIENLPIVPTTSRLTMELVYEDPDGPGTLYSVRAELIQLTNSGSPNLIAVLNSNNFPASSQLQMQNVAFTLDFNFFNDAYYVIVSIFRANAEQLPKAAIVRIRPRIIE